MAVKRNRPKGPLCEKWSKTLKSYKDKSDIADTKNKLNIITQLMSGALIKTGDLNKRLKRYHELERKLNIDEHPYKELWILAKNCLIERKILNKNGTFNEKMELSQNEKVKKTISQKKPELKQGSNIEAIKKSISEAEEFFGYNGPHAQVQNKQAKALLIKIVQYSSWGIGGKEPLTKKLNQFNSNFSEFQEILKQHKTIGAKLQEINTDCQAIGESYGIKSDVSQTIILRLANINVIFGEGAERSLKIGDKRKVRKDTENKLKKSGAPLTFVKNSRKNVALSNFEYHKNDVRGLMPSKNWDVVIDETGSQFHANNNALHTDYNNGRVVAILIPENHSINGLGKWHAIDKELEEIDEVIQILIDNQVGVFGITVTQLPATPGERWSQCILTMIDWILRILPLNGNTNINFKVENRLSYKAGENWNTVTDDAKRRLAQTYPEKARHIECRIDIISKVGSKYNGYADAVAYSWGISYNNAPAIARLDETGWKEVCLFSINSNSLIKSWDWLHRGNKLDSGEWIDLLSMPGYNKINSLYYTILTNLGKEVQEDLQKWNIYLDETISDVNNKSINLNLLGKQVDWLDKYKQKDVSIPPVLRLVWLITKISYKNHSGELAFEWEDEFHELKSRILDENAALVCCADLNFAVNATNMYDFDLARNIIDFWYDIIMIVPGRRYYGQTRSFIGQLSAFKNNNKDAVKYFDAAIEVFNGLSDKKETYRESLQTNTYRAISLMDDSDVCNEDVITALENVIGPIPDAIQELSADSSPNKKYLNHLLVRWLVVRGDEVMKQSYIAMEPYWETSSGHPWALIQLYRGILIFSADKKKAIELANDGYRLANEDGQGPVVHLIGACCRAISSAWGDKWTDYDDYLKDIEEKIPLASDRVTTVRNYLQNPGDPLTLLEEVLPFNFH
jgi:hypothetical protein